MIIDQFELMLTESGEQPLVFGISLHTFVAGQPFRLRQIADALQYIVQHPQLSKSVWITSPGEIAKYSAILPTGVVPGSA
jgi:allantoinase